MGFYLRKSISLGPFRFNLSGSGIGVSAGVKGFRVGTGPRGNYVHMGRSGFYYRQTLNSPAEVHVPQAPALISPNASLGAPLTIESAPASQMTDASSAALLEEIRQKRAIVNLSIPLLMVGIVLAILVAPSSSAAGVVVAGAAVLSAIWLHRRTNLRRAVVLMYDLEPEVETAVSRFVEWANALGACRALWQITSMAPVYNSKYHAGATRVHKRVRISFGLEPPSFLKANVPVPSLRLAGVTLCFLPDRLLVLSSGEVGAVSYQDLRVETGESGFIEEERVPEDAQVIGSTWRYVNRSGGPDRRFSNNFQIPICRYGDLTLTSPTGLQVAIQVSRADIAPGFARAVDELRRLAITGTDGSIPLLT